MSLEEKFKNIYVINLDRRQDRWFEVCAELKNIGIGNFTRFSAVDGQTLDNGSVTLPPESVSWSLEQRREVFAHIGCTRSHLGILNDAISRGADEYVVFEDDVQFSKNFTRDFDSRLAQVPAGWDCILLGGSHVNGFHRVSSGVVKIFGSYTTHGMIINKSFYDKLSAIWKNGIHVDVAAASLHRDNNCYAFNPPLAWQRAGYSDIIGKFDDYKHLK